MLLAGGSGFRKTALAPRNGCVIRSPLTPPGPDSLLWQRIEAFPLDGPGAVLTFTNRLAREQGWTHARAARAVQEYRRFVYLAVTAGHPVTPPEAVDQVWHLHLLYTRSYWQEFCGRVLGQELHHGPTAGGPAEGAKFADWYARTVESYVRIFGSVPPSGIWPPPAQRFSSRAAAWRWVDAAEHWILPRPAWTRGSWWRGLFPGKRRRAPEAEAGPGVAFPPPGVKPDRP